jgi:hypothetical protein
MTPTAIIRRWVQRRVGHNAIACRMDSCCRHPLRVRRANCVRLLLGFKLLGVLGGCSTEEPAYRLPEFQQFMHGYVARIGPVTLPSSPVSTPSQTVTQPSVITLSNAIKECLENNLSIKSSTEDVTQARADVWTASLFPNPTVTVDTVLQPFNRSSLPTPPSRRGPIRFVSRSQPPSRRFMTCCKRNRRCHSMKKTSDRTRSFLR